MVDELQPGDPARIGPYQLTGVLGGGGMGRVFLGWSPGGRPVAVKVVRADFAANAEFRARFAREVAAARTINGLYTAVLVDADLDSPVPWLATTYIEGPSLAEAVASNGPLTAEPLRALAAGLAEALAAIHAAGLIHRDLKPSNILMASDGPKVIDFGIARATETTVLTQTGQYMGSPGFLSPEQAEGREVGPATDVFSLGAVLAFAATGSSPFGTGALPSLVYRVVHGEPSLDGVPGSIRPAVERCLAKAPADRPAASDLLAEFTGARPAPWGPREPVIAPPGDRPAAGSPRAGLDSARAPAGFTPTVTTARAPGRAEGETWPLAEGGARQGGRRRLPRRVLWPAATAAAIAAAVAASLIATAGGSGSSAPPSATRHSPPAASAPTASRPKPSASVKPGAAFSFTGQGVTRYGCSAEGSVVSAASTDKVTYTFTNNSRQTIQLFWLTFTGSRRLDATMPPGDQTSWNTVVGHYWLIADTAGRCQGIFLVDSAGQLAAT